MSRNPTPPDTTNENSVSVQRDSILSSWSWIKYYRFSVNLEWFGIDQHQQCCHWSRCSGNEASGVSPQTKWDFFAFYEHQRIGGSIEEGQEVEKGRCFQRVWKSCADERNAIENVFSANDTVKRNRKKMLNCWPMPTRKLRMFCGSTSLRAILPEERCGIIRCGDWTGWFRCTKTTSTECWPMKWVSARRCRRSAFSDTWSIFGEFCGLLCGAILCVIMLICGLS